MHKILIIDDDEAVCYGLKRSLGKYYEIFTAMDLDGAYSLIKSEKFSLIFLDYRLGDENGLDVLRSIRELTKEIPVVMLTAHGSTELILDAIRMGAVDFLTKPAETKQLIEIIEKYSASSAYCFDNENFEILSEVPYNSEAVIAVSGEMKDVLKNIAIISATDTPVLITGESGTGKDVASKLIHRYSQRKDHPFININCAAIPENLLESELFGYAKGAFTGAYASNPGKFQMADKGTIFLDEIGDLPLPLQGKLLQVLQDGRIQRVGENTLKKVDIRIISATNRNLRRLVADGLFREDLYYRINAFSIEIPPLRSRVKDIWPSVLHFIKFFSESIGKNICCVEKSARETLESYRWQGNVRELKNVMAKAVAMANSGAVTKDVMISALGTGSDSDCEPCRDVSGYFRTKFSENILVQAVEEVEESIIKSVLAECQNNNTAAAKMLGISRVTLYEKLKKYGLSQ
ncbi:MAG: sigma-54-dependent transcriptional regulator [Deferribacterales bacterium]